MPFPNEHAARLKQPGQFEKFRRKELAPGVTAILGIKKGASEVQAIRFKKEAFTPDQAKAWLTEHDFKDIAMFEPAVGKKDLLDAVNDVKDTSKDVTTTKEKRTVTGITMK